MHKIHTHYDNLKVARDAPPEVIRAAYRSLSQKYHPDKNAGDQEAARIMALINASFEVLSDPTKRKRHDEWIESSENDVNTSSKTRKVPEAEECGPSGESTRSRVSSTAIFVLAQRLFAKWRVFILAGLVLWVWLGGVTKPPGPSVITPFETSATEPAPEPAAPAPAPEAPPPAPVTENAGPAPAPAPAPEAAAPAPAPEAPPPAPVAEYAGPAPAPAPAPEAAAPAPAPDAPLPAPVVEYAAPAPTPASEAAAVTGQAEPPSSGYVRGYRKLFTDGLSTVTIDNAQNDANVFVKVIALDTPRPLAIRTFFIRAGGAFKVSRVRSGNYDVRYKDLNTRGIFKTDPFVLREIATSEGTRFSNITMTLYKVRNGNMRTYPISEAEF